MSARIKINILIVFIVISAAAIMFFINDHVNTITIVDADMGHYERVSFDPHTVDMIITETQGRLMEIEEELALIEERLEMRRQIIDIFLDNNQPAFYGLLLYERSLEFGIDPLIALAVIMTESSFNPRTTNRNANGTFDRGLFQINDNTAPWIARRIGIYGYTRDMAYNPEINIIMGTYYLGYLSQLYTDLHHILTAYNRGQEGANEFINRQGTDESSYSRRVISLRENFVDF